MRISSSTTIPHIVESTAEIAAGKANAFEFDAPFTSRTKELRFLDQLSPKGERLLNRAAIDQRLDVLAQRRGASVKTLGYSQEGHPIRSIHVGRGPVTIVAMAGAHPDEPTGALTCLTLAEKLASDPALSELAETATFHLLPMANPDGTARNEAWFSSWNDAPDISEYLQGVRRDAPRDDVEFGFPRDETQAARPENAAIAGWFDSLGRIDHYVSLHSMFLGGGALMLLSADDAKIQANKLRFVFSQAEALGLPLHDKDRFGQKGFRRICAGVQTAPTQDEMKAFFLAGGQKEVAEQFKLNSMQYVRANNQAPVAMVSEIPMCFDSRLSDMSPLSHSRQEEELRLAEGIENIAEEMKGVARDMLDAGIDSSALSAFEHSITGTLAAVAAMRGDVARYSSAKATRGNALETELQWKRRRSAFLGRACALLKPSTSMATEALFSRLSSELKGELQSIKDDFRLRHPSIDTQVRLQLATLLAGLIPENPTLNKVMETTS